MQQEMWTVAISALYKRRRLPILQSMIALWEYKIREGVSKRCKSCSMDFRLDEIPLHKLLLQRFAQHGRTSLNNHTSGLQGTDL